MTNEAGGHGAREPVPEPFWERIIHRAHAIGAELGVDNRVIELKFLAFLREFGQLGVFTFGPLSISAAAVQERVERQSARAGQPLSEEEEAAFDEFFLLLAKERRKGRRNEELDLLLTFMRMQHGVVHQVFAELGISPERVEAYAAGAHATPPLEPLYSPEEAAEYLRVHVETVRSWIRSGRLRAQRLAGQRALRIRASDLARILEPLEPDDEG